jgi:hypothetical protein
MELKLEEALVQDEIYTWIFPKMIFSVETPVKQVVRIPNFGDTIFDDDTISVLFDIPCNIYLKIYATRTL